MSIAVAEWLLSDPELTQQKLEDSMVRWGHKYPRAGYGGAFANWLFSPQFLYGYRDDTNTDEESKCGTRHPYNSWGNGSAMRASACGWVSRSIEEALDLGKRSAEITPEVARKYTKADEFVPEAFRFRDQPRNKVSLSMIPTIRRLLLYGSVMGCERIGYVLDYLHDAKETFKQLLEHDGSRTYAENELKYIEKIKNQKRNG